MTPGEVSRAIGGAALCFPNLSLSTAQIDAWYSFFRDTGPQVFQNAMIAAVKEPGRKFFPTPGEVQSYIEAQKNTPSADVAWAAVRSAAAAGRSDEHLTPEAREAVRLIGGIGRVGRADYERDFPFLERDFRRVYNERRDHHSTQERLGIAAPKVREILQATMKKIDGGKK